MNLIVARYYRLISLILLIGALTLAFYVGTLQGKETASAAVTLSCSPDVLQQLAIPLGSANTAPVDSNATSISEVTTSTPATQEQGMFIGSKNGTKYYTPNCAAAKRIKAANIIWFKDAEDATVQGYTKATSC